MAGHAKILVSTVFAVALLTGSAGAARADDPKDTAAVLAVEQNMAAAQTVGQVLKYTAGDIVFDDSTPGEVKGFKNFSTDIAAQFAAVKDLKVTILSMTVVADPQLAYAFSRQKLSLVIRKTNQSINVILRQTDCYQKIGGKWLMVYQHLSFPYDPKTGKAVFYAAP